MMEAITNVQGPTLAPSSYRKDVRAAAEGLEAAFLAEFLKAAKLGETPALTGGGIGEDQFASFLRQLQAEEMVKAGGIGLSNAFEAALSEVRE